jgi:hypothetical protein
MATFDLNRNDALESLDVIEEQLEAVPNKTEHVKDKLAALAQAKRVRYPIANLYAKVWADKEPHASAAAQLLSAAGLDTCLGRGLEPGTDIFRAVNVEPFGAVKIYGTVNEEGVLRVLDVARQASGNTIDRDAWMGSHHNHFALLLAIKHRRSEATPRSRQQLHETLEDLKEDGAIHGWGQNRLTSRYIVAVDRDRRHTGLSVADAWALIGRLRPSLA